MVNDAISLSNNPFWRYSLERYSKKKVQCFLLNAQNKYQLDINLVLFCGWLAVNNQSLDSIKAQLKVIQSWQENMVKPIRLLRMQLKDFCQNDEDAENIRDKIKSIELNSEQVQQLKLYEISQHCPTSTKIDQYQQFKHNLTVVTKLDFVDRGSIDIEWYQEAYALLIPNTMIKTN